MSHRQITMGEITQEYQAFTDKFKPKLTTDDCYTPDNIYEVVRSWVFEHYGLPADTPVVRPFWPGGDYQAEEYPDGCVVIDNPPFSIISDIQRFYLAAGIPFFLFAQGTTLFKSDKRIHYVIVGESITFANGASININFVTSLGDYLIETAPDLYQRLKEANKANLRETVKELPKYAYPMEVVTAARCNYYAAHGTAYRVRPEEAHFVRKLDDQDRLGKTLYGAGFLISERAAAERAAAERAAAERAAAERAAAENASATVWELSEREKEIIRTLGKP